MIQSICFQLIKVGDIVKSEIEDSSVMLARADKDGWLSSKEEVMGICWMKRENIPGMSDSKGKGSEQKKR
jgi:hypothetical protein